MLICAIDYKDAFEKLQLVVEKCRERNISLKLSKSWFGFDHAEFFGYFCQQGSYKLTSERINEVTAIPFPTGNNKLRKLQSYKDFWAAQCFSSHSSSTIQQKQLC
jgi:hypothetical protein